MVAMGRPLMTMRGPGMIPRWIPERIEKPTRFFAPFSRAVVTPLLSIRRTLATAIIRRESSSRAATPSPGVPSPGATMWVCAST